MMDMPFLSTIEDPGRREVSAAVAKVLVDKKNKTVEMQEVLEQSGMPYDAVTKAFRDLDDVLLSLVGCVSAWIGAPLRSRTGRPASYDDMLEGLIEFGRRYAHANATILPGIFRVFLTESSRRSQLKQKFYDAGPAAISKSLTGFLEGAKSAKLIEAPASDLVAEALMGLLREPLYDELAIHAKALAPTLSSVDHAPDVVRLFVKGCARRQDR